MARAIITPVNVNTNPVAEPAPVTLDSNGGSLPNGECILRLHNPTGATVDATVTKAANGIADLPVTVAAGATAYVAISDTAYYRQDDGTMWLNGSGLTVVALTTNPVG